MMLQGRVALVTGAGGGIGRALCLGLAREGAVVIATDRSEEACRATADAVTAAGGRAEWAALDVTDRTGAAAVLAGIMDRTGDVSILVNGAGICPRHGIDDPTLFEAWDAVMKVNLDGALNVTMAVLPALKRTRGCIVNIASIAAFVSTATSLGYSTSKAALKMLTQNLAQELAQSGVRVNAIAPGTIATEMTTATRNDPARAAKFLARIPMARFGEPEELVGPVVFLCSPMSTYVTGTTLVVDGGYLAV
ncbi:MAG: SDR family NAD(P)-dependent oxidoreductase [Phreatobacter sp.]|jgi:NAD(P)-dependent dehydrogenase (short-subunit alcohol dehydrogenase family)|uniref:SDR family NAD(P)-dependent oxidoreductase n=1 Tax=Phreatobacter sp. TaxID=1966341 RepID=UPI0040357C51